MNRTIPSILLVLTLLACPARADELRIATMRLGTSWYVFGATLYRMLEDRVPEGTRIEVIARGGGIVNPIVVGEGKADIGLSNAVSASWAYHGHAGIYQGRRHTGIRALAGGLNPVWFCVLVREGYLRGAGGKSLDALLLRGRPPRIVMKPRGSVVPVIADMVLESLGTDRRELRSRGGRILQVDAKQIPAILRDGRADLYLDAVPVDHPTLTAITLHGGVRFLDLPEASVAFLAGQGLQPGRMPVSYPGQKEPVSTVDLGTLLIANRELPEETAWLITRTICENTEEMARSHKAWKDFDPTVAWKEERVRIPLHPGALRYYRERGWIEP